VIRPAQSVLRGLGREAYRAGSTAAGSTVHAREALGRQLSSEERAQVMAGWRDERSEVVS
jgi:hypothetical protein